MPGPDMGRTAPDGVPRPGTLVWIDAREAVIVRLEGVRAALERVESDVPAHHRSTGHVRHDPGVRHGGGGSPQTAGEPRRLEHLGRFVEQIVNRLAPDDLLILGPGTVREQLERRVREIDEGHGRSRHISCQAASRLTDRQLVARLRHEAGADLRRRTVGAYRWTGPPHERPSGEAQPPPRRVLQKPPSQRDRGER
jgi:hypothetical protein